MARGQKLDIFIGANINDGGWAEVQTPNKSKISNEIKEPSKHFLIFSKEKRAGKTITIVGKFFTSKDDTSTTLKNLKKKLGCGGILKNGFMEFQGELKDKIRPLLIDAGFRFKHGH